MVWQDIGIMIVQWAALVALLPTLWSKDKPPILTSIFTGTLLVALGFIFSTLHFWSSMISSLAVGIIWLVIGFQKYRIDKLTGPVHPTKRE